MNKYKTKSTITVMDTERGIEIHAAHEPALDGPSETWPHTARLVESMMRKLVKGMEEKGIKPVVEAMKSSHTGELFITTREKKKEE